MGEPIGADSTFNAGKNLLPIHLSKNVSANMTHSQRSTATRFRTREIPESVMEENKNHMLDLVNKVEMFRIVT